MTKNKTFLQFWKERTKELLGLEKVVYLELLVHQCENNDLPNSWERLASIAGMPKDEFKELWPNIKPLFTKEGERYHDAELRELTKRPVRKKPIPVKKIFEPPSKQDVIEFFEENGYTKESAVQAYIYYSDGNPPWTDSKGHQVRSWKQKMRAVWFKPENEIRNNSQSIW